MDPRVEKFMAAIKAKNPGENEFHQAVHEVAESLIRFIEENPKYKHAKILDRIADGKLNKFFQENCLVEQSSIKDNTKSVGDLLKDFNSKFSSEATIKLFHRFHLSDENK
jgi:translation elongation factor EF-Ts